jgi:glycosyltransferase involved in cell wall biosynthesis
MKIGLDLRFLKNWDYYSDFVLELVKNLIRLDKENKYILFLNINYSHLNFWENSKNITVNTWNLYEEQIKFKKVLDKQKLDNVIFFTYNKPLKYKCNYILFIPDLEEFHFSPKKNIFKKHFDNYLLSENSKNANKIICFNEKIKIEINDKLNIFEDNIHIITPCFNIEQIQETNFNLDIKTKYNILNNYLIYYFWPKESSNLDRIIDIFEEIKKQEINLSLVILDNQTSQSIELRKKVIDKQLNKQIYFIGNVTKTEEYLFFKNAIWVLYPVLYSIFPFSLSKAINYKSNIISSDLENIKFIFKDKISYFNPTDINDMFNKITDLKKSKNINYDFLTENYNLEKTTSELINIIK